MLRSFTAMHSLDALKPCIKAWCIALGLTSCSLFTSACNSVFYHPDNVLYISLDDVGVPVEESFVTSRNGKKVHVLRFLPQGPKKGVVVHFHGNAQNLTAHLSFSYWLPKEGYELVTFDYQGYGKSEGEASRPTTVEDGVAVLEDTLRRSGEVPVFVFGQSLGAAVGFVSLAHLDTTRSVCGMLYEASFASYRSLARMKLGQFFLTWPLQWPLSFLVGDALSPVDFVDKVNVPILFAHGSGDHVVPLKAGRALFEAYPGPKEWIEIPGAGHTAAFGNETSPYRKTLLRFIEKNCS